MKIYIYNCPNTYNYGSMMMGENFIKYFNKITEEKNEYYVETTDSKNTNRLIKATEIKEIYPIELNSLFKKKLNKYDYLFSFLGCRKLKSEFANKIDLVVVLGGDDFTEDYGWKNPLINAIRFWILKKESLKVVMLGQTMGPYKAFRIPIMKKLLNRMDKIYPRDPITYRYLEKLKFSNISIIDDLALLPLSKQIFIERTKKFITYCPSELIYRYSKEGSREDWINFNLFMITTLMDKYPSKKIVLLAHVLRPEHVDDRVIVNELYDKVIAKYRDRIVIINNEIYPYEVRNYIQQSLFTISSRMHPIISSIQCEIPVIALSYSTKYWGIIGERYELSDFIIDVRYLSYEKMKEKFLYLVSVIENEYTQIQNKMTEKNCLARKSIKLALSEIQEIYINGKGN